jgi:hypothetical protein
MLPVCINGTPVVPISCLKQNTEYGVCMQCEQCAERQQTGVEGMLLCQCNCTVVQWHCGIDQ